MTSTTSYTSFYQNCLMGFIMGSTEAAINHPIWALGTRLQGKMPLTLNPKILYRGFGMHCAGSLPVDLIQTVATRTFFERALPEQWDEHNRRTLGGLFGGVCSTAVVCPMEMVMTRQQQCVHETSLSAIRAIYSQGGVRRLFTGWAPLCVREAIFCAGVFGGISKIAQKCQDRSISPLATSLIAGIGAGTITTICSHPFEVMRTRMQTEQPSLSFSSTARRIYKEENLLGFYKGVQFRILRVSSAVFILGM